MKAHGAEFLLRVFVFLTLVAVVPAGQPVRAQDADGDGVADGVDNCVNVFNAGQADDDVDSVGNVCDCNPDENTAFTLLGPGANLMFSNATDLNWIAPVDTGGGGLIYDLLRSPMASNLNVATCLKSNDPSTVAVDAATPATNDVFYYVLRAEGICGGNLGADNQEARRSGTPCPAVTALGACAEDMDITCPDAAPACGVTFSGGNSCLFEGLGNCYSTGLFSYKVTQAAPLTIGFTGNVYSLDLFFANEVAGTLGTMRFFDVDNIEVDSSLTTNGVCGGLIMPPVQNVDFTRAVRRIEVTADGPGNVWIDTFTVNANAVATCTENMDMTCPDAAPNCSDLSFSGGLSCLFEGLGNCYSTGLFSYKVTQAAPLTIDFTGNVYSLDLFFANEVAGTLGTMRFFDVDNIEVDSSLTTNGVCGGLIMPPSQSVTFSRPVRRIDVTATGAGAVWIDTFTVNP